MRIRWHEKGKPPNRCHLIPKPPVYKVQGNRRSVTIPAKRIVHADKCLANLLFPERYYWRPLVRADCVNGPRPCPYVGCRYNLFLDAIRTGIRINFPEYEVWDLPVSCALDCAESGPCTLDEIGAACNVTRERARQIETRALMKLKGIEQCQKLLDILFDLEQPIPPVKVRPQTEG